MLHPNYHGDASQRHQNPRLERPRKHKGFTLRRKKDGLITIRDADGNLLSATMKFIDFKVARSFLDHWVATQKKQGK